MKNTHFKRQIIRRHCRLLCVISENINEMNQLLENWNGLEEMKTLNEAVLRSRPTQTPGAGSTDTDTDDGPKQGQLSDKLGDSRLQGAGRTRAGGKHTACRQKLQPVAAEGDGSLSTVSLTSVRVWGSTWHLKVRSDMWTHGRSTHAYRKALSPVP